MLPTFQSRLMSALKAEGLIPMSTGVTKVAPNATSYGEAIDIALEEMSRARSMFGTRSSDRYSTDVGTSYRDQRYELIRSFESVALTAYDDVGSPAIGLGFRMDNPDARSVWTKAFGTSGPDFDQVYKGKASISPSQAKSLFDHSILYYEKVVDQALGGRSVSTSQRLALVSVAYNAPARVVGWKDTLRNGTDEAIMDLILHQSFNPNNPHSEALKKRRYSEASLFASGSAPIPAFSEYSKRTAIDPKTGNALLVEVDKPTPTSLAALRYTNSGATRNLSVDTNLERRLQEGVTAIYGPDYTVEVFSGGQGKGSTGKTGSPRHDDGGAADVWVYDPNGRRLGNSEVVPLAQHWLSQGIGSVGIATDKDGHGLHLDLHGGKGDGARPQVKRGASLWFYGGEDAALRKTLASGQAPTYRYGLDAVRKGLIPPKGMESDPPVPRPRLEGQMARVLKGGQLTAPDPAGHDQMMYARSKGREATEQRAARLSNGRIVAASVTPATSLTAPTPHPSC
jgi:GH24 family phage-related lysozyme (muramidase)